MSILAQSYCITQLTNNEYSSQHTFYDTSFVLGHFDKR